MITESQHDVKHVVLTPLSDIRIRVGKRRRGRVSFQITSDEIQINVWTFGRKTFLSVIF
jgi:hypothetical protein